MIFAKQKTFALMKIANRLFLNALRLDLFKILILLIQLLQALKPHYLMSQCHQQIGTTTPRIGNPSQSTRLVSNIKRELLKESCPSNMHVIQVLLAINKLQSLVISIQNKLPLH